MKIKLFDKILVLLLFVSCMLADNKEEKEIIATMLNSKKEIESLKVENSFLCEGKKCMFLAFWDFDGTILKGDCSEGLKEEDKVVYTGLVELAILKAYAKDYKGKEGLAAFEKSYQTLYEKDRRGAYIFAAKIFEGNEERVMQSFAQEHFKEVLQKYYFPSSVRIMDKLKSAGIQSYIVSASSDFFVKGSIGTTPVEENFIHGIKMKLLDGKITPNVILPVTYGVGKLERIQLIVETILKEKKADRVFILAGFGNSFLTDGPFLKYIAEQKLEAGKPIAIMINGGNSLSEYKGLFKEVSFDVKK